MTDPETTKLIIIGAGSAGAAKAATELVKDFAVRVFGPSADEVGKLIASPFARLNQRRAERAAQLIETAAHLIASREMEAQHVPDYLLLPLLSHGSLIDEADLQAVWAQLLGSAATEPDSVWPSFPQILSELSAREVRLLNSLLPAGELDWHQRHGFRISLDIRNGELATNRAPDDHLMVENLIRLGLLRQDRRDVELHPEKLAEMLVKLQRGQAYFPLRLDEQRFGPEYSITALGVAFVVACAGPGSVVVKKRD